MTNQSIPPRFRHKLIAAACALFLLALPSLLPPDGHSHANWQQFLGRFHPLAIHLPLALLLLIPILELAGKSRPALRETAAFLLPWTAACTVATALLGILLAHGAGFSQEAVRSHMWSAIILSLTVLLATLLRPPWQSGANLYLYPTTLAAAALLTFWTGHQGGSITYGKGYLTHFLPHPRPRGSYPPVDPTSVYATRIQPIFNTNCISCHGSAKQKGGLELDTYAHLMDGGNSGQVIVERHPETSILLTRITLPRSDRKAMPSEGKPPLSPQDIALIQTWIQQGASPLATPSPAASSQRAPAEDLLKSPSLKGTASPVRSIH